MVFVLFTIVSSSYFDIHLSRNLLYGVGLYYIIERQLNLVDILSMGFLIKPQNQAVLEMAA